MEDFGDHKVFSGIEGDQSSRNILLREEDATQKLTANYLPIRGEQKNIADPPYPTQQR